MVPTTMRPSQGVLYGIQSPDPGYIVRYSPQGEVLGVMPPHHVGGTPGMGRTYYPSGWVNWS